MPYFLIFVIFLPAYLLLADTPLQRAKAPEFDTACSHYDAALQLTIISSTPGASIRITSDGHMGSLQRLDLSANPGETCTH